MLRVSFRPQPEPIPGWVRTIHSSQGATCERVMAHLESFRANTVDAASVYVAISRARARASAVVYTDSRAGLTEALGLRDGAQVGAVDDTLRCDRLTTASEVQLPTSIPRIDICLG